MRWGRFSWLVSFCCCCFVLLICFFLQVILDLWDLKYWFIGRTLDDVKQVCVSSALLATLSSWIWHTIYLTVHLVLLRQGKSHKTSLVHQHFHCVLSWASFHMVASPILVQYSLSLPLPQTCLFLWHLLLVSLSSVSTLCFLWGPGS